MARVKAGRWELESAGSAPSNTRTSPAAPTSSSFDASGVFANDQAGPTSTSPMRMSCPSVHLRYDASEGVCDPGLGHTCASFRGRIFSDLLPTPAIRLRQPPHAGGQSRAAPLRRDELRSLGGYFSRKNSACFSTAVFAKEISRTIVELQTTTTIGDLGEFPRAQAHQRRQRPPSPDSKWAGRAFAPRIARKSGQSHPELVPTRCSAARAHSARTGPAKTVPLPGQADHQGSASVQLERGAFFRSNSSVAIAPTHSKASSRPVTTCTGAGGFSISRSTSRRNSARRRALPTLREQSHRSANPGLHG